MGCRAYTPGPQSAWLLQTTTPEGVTYGCSQTRAKLGQLTGGEHGSSRLSSPQDSDLHGHAMLLGWMPSARELLRQAQIYYFVITCFGVVTATHSLENPGAAFSRTYQADREEICGAGNILCGGVSRAPGTGPFVCSQSEAETDKGQELGEGLRHLGALVVLHQDTCP